MDKVKRKKEDSITKHSETSREEDEHEESTRYRDLLYKVGEKLAIQHVDALADLALLSAREKDEISRSTGNKSLHLFRILEEKGKINQNDLQWLHSNLIKIEYQVAAEIVSNYISAPEETPDFPNEPESSSSDDSDECSSFRDFLSRIGLEDMFPCKLTLKVLLAVKDVQEEQSYVESFWEKLTSLDYRAGLPDHSLSNRFSMRDFIFGVLHCSDDFVRQDILEKMSACQLAVPIVLKEIDDEPTTFLLWALRRITKKWKGPHDSLSIEQPIVSYPVFTVSTLRIGDIAVSKSQILNTMLSCSQGNSLHSYFLTEEKDIVKPKFSKGTIECAWFLPMCGNDKEIFKEAIAFLNLRGDCRNHPIQTKFACRSSNYTIVFIDTDKREENVNFIRQIKLSARHFLFVAIKKDVRRKPKSPKVHHPKYDNCWLFVKVLHMDVLSKKICDMIVHTSGKEEKRRYTCLKDLSKVAGEMLNVDEHNKVCTNAQRLVADLFTSSDVDNILDFKKCCLPLQDIWKELVDIEKERFDSEDDKHASFEHQREHVLLQKKSKRESQLKTSLTETMKKYFNMIKAGNKNNPASLHYILGFFQEQIYHVVNENTREDMDKILQLERLIRKQQAVIPDISTLDNTSDVRSEIEIRSEVTCQDMVTECRKLHKQCSAKNLGSEHFLRELGQLYEASKELKESRVHTNLDSAEIILLPELAASLVNEMHSLEILDGDTGSVPLTWVTNVLDALTRKFEDPKVLVLSVIGVQSSGKSTFLNSMFGARFPVRAGRCTRGLFIRFLRMDEKLEQELGCQYLIVVDTEGIRSLNHGDPRFDNELVTLALSIANVTIFNIEGENIGPDMTGILQIAAHALMRMKEVDLECHCRIVQQRVSDLTAGDRNKANTNRIIEMLDHATKIAAEEEGLESCYQVFADVVDLRVDENLQYIPCLWTGGMSPPNHMYSETVRKIKSQLFKDIKDKNIVSDFTLSTFTQRIIDVWKAVKEEDFIFNFQDSVRAVDFNKFCLEYNKWIADMRSKMMAHTNSLVVRMQSVLTDDGNGDLDIEELKQSINSQVEKQRQALTKAVETYITNHERRKTVQRYKTTFLEEMNIVMNDIENHSTAVLADEYELQKFRLTKNVVKFKAEWRHRLAFEAKRAAASITANRIECSPDFEFSKLRMQWDDMVNNEYARNETRLNRSSLITVCEKLLLRITRDMAVGSEVRTLMTDEGGIGYHNQLPNDCSRYIHTKFVKAWMRHRLLSTEYNEDTKHTKSEEELINDERREAVKYVYNIIGTEITVMKEKQSGKPFDGNIFQLMLQNTLDKLSEKHGNFKPPQTLIAKSLLCIAGRSLNFLELNERSYGNKLSPLLEKEYASIYRDFLAFLNMVNHYEAAAAFVYYYLKPLVRKKFDSELNNKKCQLVAVVGRAHITSWDVLRFIAEQFSSSLSDLFKNLFLVPFDSWSPHVQLRSQQCMGRLRTELQNETTTLIANFTHIVETCKTESGTLTDWGKRLAINLDCRFISAVGELFQVHDVAVVSDSLKQKLWNLLDKLVPPTLSFYPWNFGSPYGMSFLCHAVCPMCKAPCDNSLIGHNRHFSHLHRPRGFNAATYLESNKLIIEDCCSSVRDKYSKFKYEGRIHFCYQYKSIFPDWDIRPSVDDPGKVFWQWLFAMYNNYMASLYKCKPADIPKSWYNISKDEAIESLEKDKILKLDGRFHIIDPWHSMQAE